VLLCRCCSISSPKCSPGRMPWWNYCSAFLYCSRSPRNYLKVCRYSSILVLCWSTGRAVCRRCRPVGVWGLSSALGSVKRLGLVSGLQFGECSLFLFGSNSLCLAREFLAGFFAVSRCYNRSTISSGLGSCRFLVLFPGKRAGPVPLSSTICRL
jgi:hypothetical protein